jgi:hypothetical protein
MVVDHIEKRLENPARMSGSRFNIVYGNRDFAANGKVPAGEFDQSGIVSIHTESDSSVPPSGGRRGPAEGRLLEPAGGATFLLIRNGLQETEEEDIVQGREGRVWWWMVESACLSEPVRSLRTEARAISSPFPVRASVKVPRPCRLGFDRNQPFSQRPDRRSQVPGVR